MSQNSIIKFLVERRITDGPVYHSKKEIVQGTGTHPKLIDRQLCQLVRYGYIERRKSLQFDYRYRVIDKAMRRLKVAIK